MATSDNPPCYGVREQLKADSDVERAVEDIRLFGFAVVPGGYNQLELDELAAGFDQVQASATAMHGGRDTLAAIDEHHTVRAMLAYDLRFLTLARNPSVLAICDQLLGGYFLLNQQNGIVNPPFGERYNQQAFHRDLPYQHFVSSRPLAVNALFCLDSFTADNGATLVLPATHKQEAFPSDDAVRQHALQVTAARGCFIVLDCMVYHSGGVNLSSKPRRAVNHVYSIPPIRQQFDLPAMLGDRYSEDPVLGPFLGYEVRAPASVAEFYAERRRRLGTSGSR